MKGYNLTPTEYSKYYATLPRQRAKRGAQADPSLIDRATINRKIRQGVPLPGVLHVTVIGGRNILTVNKRCFEAYENIISPNGK